MLSTSFSTRDKHYYNKKEYISSIYATLNDFLKKLKSLSLP